MDEEKEWMDINIDREVDRAIRYDDYSFDDLTNDNDGDVED